MTTTEMALTQEQLALCDQADLVRRIGGIVISDQLSYDATAERLKLIQATRKEVAEHHDGAIADAHALHKKLIGMKAKYDNPLAMLESACKTAIIRWDRQQEQARQEEQRRVEAEHQAKLRLEEKARVAAAKENGAGRSEVAEIRRDVQSTPAPTVAPSYTRSAGVSTAANWQAQIDDVGKLVKWVVENLAERLYLLEPDKLVDLHPALNALAKAQKARLSIPGVTAIDKGRVSARG